MTDETAAPPAPPAVEPTPAPEPADNGADFDSPPRHRWAELKSRLGQEQQRADAAAARAAKLEAQLADAKAAHQAAEAEWSTRTDLIRHGIDDAPGMAAARAAFDALGDERPASIGEWLEGVKSAASREEDPEPLPRWAAPYLGGTAPPKAEPKPGGIRSLEVPTSPPAANGAVTDDGLRAIMASGDRDALIKALQSRGVKYR